MMPSTTIRHTTDERAVSPVIGVILMVAITVILAAVIGTFVLDLGQVLADEAPQASLSVDSNTANDNVTIEHVGGDPIDAARTRLVITNESDGSVSEWSTAGATDTLQVGGTVEVDLTPTTDRIAATGAWTALGDSGAADGGDRDVGTIQSGVEYTIQLIDTDTQRIIYETTVTA